MREALADFYATRFRRATLLFCVANAAFFAALFLTYFYLKANAKDWPTPFHFASLLMSGAMTMFSLSGSVTAGFSAYAAKLREREPAVRWMAIAISCWLIFLFLEIVEWVRMAFIIQMGPRTQFGQIFFVLTGFHFLCIFGCVMWLAVVTTDTQHRDVLAASIYSHFLNVIWLAIIFVLYFNNADLEGL